MQLKTAVLCDTIATHASVESIFPGVFRKHCKVWREPRLPIIIVCLTRNSTGMI